jgi:uncharacterized membrane protein (Fun14 family)
MVNYVLKDITIMVNDMVIGKNIGLVVIYVLKVVTITELELDIGNGIIKVNYINKYSTHEKRYNTI